MRVLVAVLFLAIAVFAEDPQAVAPDTPVLDNFSIPARLSKTIDTNKCKAGDAVEMQTLEPVLITKGLVMPENSKLHGKVLGAASRQEDRPSWLVLVVERAEWKQHDVPLHAFVAARITVKSRSSQGDPINPFRGSRTPRLARAPGKAISTSPTPPADAVLDRNDALPSDYSSLDDVRLMRANNGAVFLVSQKPHLKLPSGTMFMLRNQLIVPKQQPATTNAADSAQ
jgi:hypothetical protein